MKNKVTTKKVYLQTWGCQMNEYDSELLRSILRKDGFIFADNEVEADVILLNTCSVRDKATRTVFGLIHKIRHNRQHEPAIYGILGCMATHLKEELINDSHLNIDLIVGPDSYKNLPKLIKQCMNGEPSAKSPAGKESPGARANQNPKLFDIALSNDETYEDIYPDRESDANAWIAIMRGCNNFCSYCVVPYTRGRERSRSPESIISETQKLIADGFAQVTLLGQNVNSYAYQDCTFPKLLSMVADVDGVKRVWFTSPHPKDVADDLIDLIAGHPKICKHIHLPLQAGNNAILEKMNRPYTKEQYLALVDKLRAACPQIAITTDIIVGFPTETDEQFRDTVDVFKRVGYDSAFIFKYSPRKDTRAANDFSDDVPEEIKTQRIVYLNELQQKHALERNQGLIGTTQTILVNAIRDNEIEGRTIHNKRVILTRALEPQSPSSLEKLQSLGSSALGSLLNVQITSATPHLLQAKLISS